MKKKEKQSFECEECGFKTVNWMGKCNSCSQWNTLVQTELSKFSKKYIRPSKVKKLSEITKDDSSKFLIGMAEFDRVVGNGLTKGSLTLIGGEPGIGKSTLLMSVASKILSSPKFKVLYISGEESESQIAQRAERLKIYSENLLILNEKSWKVIDEAIKEVKPDFLVLDSIQTTIHTDIQAVAGSISQIREVTSELMDVAKNRMITVLVVGHVTKDGAIAGPKVLEHMVDTVIYFEGDQTGQYRILRSIKNRFGNTNEIGLFEMKENGLNEISNPSKYFINNSCEKLFGKSITCIIEGTRPIFVETQSLVVDNSSGNGRRYTQGVDSNRLSILIAIVEKYFGLPLMNNDVYINVVGGIRLSSRDSDLSLLVSLLSSYFSKSVDNKIIFLGEIGLTGEVRGFNLLEKRLNEIQMMNYKTVVLSEELAGEARKSYPHLDFIGIKMAVEIVDNFF
ncbi:MAG: DNA repair protein RadA/Sms [Thermoproteota archaeon]|jgi:DNA repair protein RadA/Sms